MILAFGEAILKTMMKRVSVNSHQSRLIDEDARIKHRHQSLLQDYLELQKVRAFMFKFSECLCWGLFSSFDFDFGFDFDLLSIMCF